MRPYVLYWPEGLRTPDTQYKGLLREILNNGEWVTNQMDERALTILGAQVRFDLSNGVPIITERDVVTLGKNGRSYFTQALGEIIGFLNGAHTQAELEDYGCHWWKNWVTPEKCAKRGLEPGDLGPGSYGSAWTSFPMLDGTGFNQIDALLAQIKERPHLRTHNLSPWIPQYVFRAEGYEQKVVVVPCHGWVRIMINVGTGNMSLLHHQRSADVPVGFPANMIGYTALLLMLAKNTGYTADQIIFTIEDAHIYERQMSAVEKLLVTDNSILPTLAIDGDVEDIRDYRISNFIVDEYYPGSRMTIPTPV